jgi:kinesin family protein 20/kinesin family protein 23
MQGLSLGGESDSDLSAYILPSKKARRVTAVDEESASEEDELDTIKKKKRYIYLHGFRSWPAD